MRILVDNIFVIWMLPVFFQIVLPLLMLLVYGVFRVLHSLFITESGRMGINRIGGDARSSSGMQTG